MAYFDRVTVAAGQSMPGVRRPAGSMGQVEMLVAQSRWQSGIRRGWLVSGKF